MRDSKEIIIVGVLDDYYERAARIYDGGGYLTNNICKGLQRSNKDFIG